MVMNMYLVW